MGIERRKSRDRKCLPTAAMPAGRETLHDAGAERAPPALGVEVQAHGRDGRAGAVIEGRATGAKLEIDAVGGQLSAAP